MALVRYHVTRDVIPKKSFAQFCYWSNVQILGNNSVPAAQDQLNCRPEFQSIRILDQNALNPAVFCKISTKNRLGMVNVRAIPPK